MSVKSEPDNEGKHNVLDTVEGEISFFKALMRARPLGINRYFHIMAMKIALDKELRGPVHVNDIWEKLESCYNMEALETLVRVSFFLTDSCVIEHLVGVRV